MGLLDFFNDKTGFREVMHGSDGRGNVDSRSAERIYHNSRIQSEAYTLVFDDANATAGDFVAYLKNTDANGRHLVVHSIGVNCEAATSKLDLLVVTGTQVGGAVLTPGCLNRAAPKSAAVLAAGPADSNSTPMTGLTDGVELDHASIPSAWGHEEFRISDGIRLGQDVAIAIKLGVAAAIDVRTFGVIFFYFE